MNKLFYIVLMMLAISTSGCANNKHSLKNELNTNPYEDVKKGNTSADDVYFDSNSEKENNILTNMIKHGLKNENVKISFTSPSSDAVFSIVYGDGYKKKGVYCKPFLINKEKAKNTIDYIGRACFVNEKWVLMSS